MGLIAYCTNPECKDRFKSLEVDKDEAIRLKYKIGCESCHQDLYFLDRPLL